MEPLATQLVEQLKHLLQTNPFITGGASVAIIAFLANWVRAIPGRFCKFIQHHLLTSCRIDCNANNAQIYENLQTFIEGADGWFKHSIAYVKSDIAFTPAHGWRKWFIFRGSLFLIAQMIPRDGADSSTAAMSDKTLDAMLAAYKPAHFNIRCFSLNKYAIRDFLKHVSPIRVQALRQYVQVYTNRGSSWEFRKLILPRDSSSVITDGTILEDIRADLEKFQASRERYEALGLPYHRGYLLSGPPGNGKTSIVHAITSHFPSMSLYILNLSSVKGDADLTDLFAHVACAIVLIEDVDGLFVARDAEEDLKVTFSGLLNALDGFLSTSGQVIFMTTNYPDKLDEALFRAGRIDRHIKIENASRDQARRMFSRFFPDAPEFYSDTFANEFSERKLSVAKIQEHLLQYDGNPKGAVSNAYDLRDSVGITS